ENVFLEKAVESLEGATSEYVNSRYNNCANRCYNACFQAAIYALVRAGIRPPGARDEWGHDFVQAQFNGQLINRRKLYPADLRTALSETYAWRQVADYKRDHVPEIRATRIYRRTEEFVETIRRRGGRRT